METFVKKKIYVFFSPKEKCKKDVPNPNENGYPSEGRWKWDGMGRVEVGLL